jgi:hypothetical protein
MPVNWSTVITSADTTAPTLSSLTAAKSGATAWTGSVSTDEGNGTLYYLVSENSSELAATVKAANSKPVTATGTQNVSGGGVTPSTTYYLHVLHRDAAGNDSTVTSSSGFTTDALGSGTGTVTISVDRQMNEMAAPAGVFITVGVTGASVSEPAGMTSFDPTLEGLWYHVDWGDTGKISDKVVNLPEVHNDLNISYAKHCGHVYTAPGSYTITATVREKDGTLVGVDTQAVTITDPDTVYTGDRTILVNAAGAGDGAYSGAQVVTTLTAAINANKGSPTSRKRILLKRGETFAASTGTYRFKFGEEENVYIGAYGTGANPVIDSTASGANSYIFDVTGAHPDDAVFTDIDFLCPHDPDNETGARHTAIMVTDPDSGITGQRVLVNNVTFNGVGMALQWGGNGTQPMLLLMDNCAVNGWNDYGILGGPHQDGLVSITGTSITQSENARMGGQGKNTAANQHGPMRFTHDKHIYISGCDIFSRNSWFSDLNSQPCVRFFTSPNAYTDKGRLIFERNACEGGSHIIAMANASGGTPTNQGICALFEKNLFVGTASTDGIFRQEYSGVAIRNNIAIVPDVPWFNNNPGNLAFCKKESFESSSFSDTSFPVKIYANTLIVLKDNTNLTDRFSNRRNARITDIEGTPNWPTLTVEDNAVTVPNATSEAQHEAIDVTSTAMVTVGGTWESRFLGAKHGPTATWGTRLTMDTAWAAPSGFAAWQAVPNASSPLVDDATGTTPYDDFYGTVRSTADRGAVERT